MKRCEECGGNTWLVFTERFVCAGCGADGNSWTAEAAAADASHEEAPLYVYETTSSNGRTYSYEWRPGGQMVRITADLAAHYLETGQAERLAQHPIRG